MVEGAVDIDPSIEYVVLLDIETCHESNYPNYGLPNEDTLGGRITWDDSLDCFVVGSCNLINEILTSPLFRQVHSSTLVYLDCRGGDPELTFRQSEQISKQLSIVAIDGAEGHLLKDVDMGLPPPAGNPISLSEQQRRAILTCDCEDTEQRPYLLTFVGSLGRGDDNPRQHLFNLHNGDDVVVVEREDLSEYYNDTFSSLLQKSAFGATPRGDNLFSYRFTEVLSAGAIPVVHSDGWVLPFHSKLVDWSRCAVVVPELQYNQTLDILHLISRDQRCRMRQYCYEIYQRYMVNPEANMAGILESLGAIHRGIS